ncbi:TonB-dependent receptor plug domain-containing protein [Congregibacter sp.]|uniref:TonB-dependent receptor plug domain-containing protein n=1 Tax=Congregibacter sp. TaxID=2744308 RepID=UPI00385F4B3E
MKYRFAPAVITLVTSSALAASAVFAQEQSTRLSPTAAAGEIEEIVVTGSRIKRKDFTSISPLVTLDAEQITLSGVTAIEDLVNEAPQLVPDGNRTSNNPGNGQASLNLRGLGANRTLVTLNGRRMAPADSFGAADVNLIPSQLIKRVEIVTGGASTVYGSDAVAGVVNFILDDEYEGFEVTAQYDTFEEGDGAVADVSLAFGFGNDSGHLTGFLNYQDRDSVFAGDRPFTAEALREDRFTGELVALGSGTTPAGRIVFPRTFLPGSDAPVQVTFDDSGTPVAVGPDTPSYNFQPVNYLQVPLQRYSGALFGNYQLNDRIKVFGEVLYSETSTSAQLAPPPAFISARVNLDNPLLTPEQAQLFGTSYDPDGDGFADFVFSRRLIETGPRQSERAADTLRAVFGASGDINAQWDWEATYSLSEVTGEFITGNAVFASRFEQGLLADPATGECFDTSDGCVPFNPFGLTIPEDAAAFLLAGDIVENYTVDEDIFSFIVTGDAFELPAGPVGVAGGFEWRETSSDYQPDPNFIGAGVLGALAAAPVSGTTDVAELYLEALVPILSNQPFAEYLGVEAGYRYSDYKFSGVADNWKFGVDWAPISSLRFRVMAQRAVRAPNIEELFAQAAEQPTVLFNPDTDFCAASADPIGRGLTDLCIAQGIPAAQVGVYQPTPDIGLTVFEGGGNTGLDPETGDTFTAGLVIQPSWAEELSVSVDYYLIEIDNAIGSTDFEAALGLCGDSNDPASQFCSSVVRGPSGDISQYTNPQFNLATLGVEGVDLALNYRFDLWEGLALPGSDAFMTLQVLFNYAMENTVQATPTDSERDCAGYYGGACAFIGPGVLVPEYRSSTRLTYYSGPLSVALNWRWIGDLESHLDITCEESPQFCYESELGNLGDHSYFELSGRFEFGEHGEIYGGVSNLFEEDPPLMGLGATQSNTAPQLYDVFGRRFFLGLRYRL